MSDTAFIWCGQCRRGASSPAARCQLRGAPTYPKIYLQAETYAFIHGEVKGSGASVEFKGNGLDLLDLTIQIVGSVVAEVPEPLRPYVIKKIQDKIPDAVQSDLKAQGKAASAEKEEKSPVGETVGFRMARQFAETEPGFKDFIVALADKLSNG